MALNFQISPHISTEDRFITTLHIFDSKRLGALIYDTNDVFSYFRTFCSRSRPTHHMKRLVLQLGGRHVHSRANFQFCLPISRPLMP